MRTDRYEDAAIRRRFQCYVGVDDGGPRARLVRHLLMAGGLLMLVAQGAPPQWLWFMAAFAVSDFSLAWHSDWHARHLDAMRMVHLRLMQLHQAAALACVAALPIALSLQDDAMLRAAGALVLFGLMLHAVAVDPPSRDRAVVSIAGIALAIQLTVAGAALSMALTLAEAVLLHLLGGLLALYFAHVTMQAVGVQARVHALTLRLTAAQRGETVGRLTSGVAHDFNNLLTVMRGNLELMSEVPPDERGRLLAEVAAAADRGGTLVDQLMERARPGAAGRAPLDLDAFRAGFAQFSRRVLPANITLTARCAPGLTPVANAALLESALLNLVTNARDAMPGGGKIAIAAAAAALPGGVVAVAIQVTDDGPGMPPALLARATEPYVTHKPGGRGTGLGLTMVRRFAETAGGALHIDSAPGRGTRVRLTLPRDAVAALRAAG